MQGGIHKKGFTLLELTISMLFVTLLSVSIAVVVNNVISSYQRGAILSKLNSTGNSLVDDMRDAVHDSLNRTTLGNNVSIIKTTSKMTIGGVTQTNIPIYGVFCSGSYTYFWNSGYYFTDDATFTEKQSGWAKIKISDNKYYNPNNVSNKPTFRLVKVQDTEREICIKILEKARSGPNSLKINNGKIGDTFDISVLNKEETNEPPEVITILQNDNDNDLALYDLLVEIPATSLNESMSLYNVSFILGTTTGGVDIAISGNSCAAPIGDPNWNNSCAASRFNFVTQSNATDIGVVEQVFLGQIPEAPEVTPPKINQITYKNTNCPSNPLATKVLKNNGVVAPNTFVCQEADFLGWNTSQIGNGDSYQPGDTIDDENDVTLYAMWKARVYYTITYYGNGNTDPVNNWITLNSVVSVSKLLEGSTYTIKNNTWQRRFYKFNGWGLNATDTTATYSGGEQITVTSNLNLYALWTVGGSEIHTVTPGFQDGDTALSVILLIPNYNRDRNIRNNGNSEGSDTGIAQATMEYQGEISDIFETDISHFKNPDEERYACEQLTPDNDSGYVCTTRTTYMAAIYRMFKTSTKSAVFYIMVDEALSGYPKNNKINSDTMSNYSFFASSAYEPYQPVGTQQSDFYYKLGNYIGDPMGFPFHPYYYDFATDISPIWRFADRLVAGSEFLPTRIYGKNGKNEVTNYNKTIYWVIAKMNYNASNKSVSIQSINAFTNDITKYTK